MLARRDGVASPHPMRLSSRQADATADNDRYWPTGFLEELIAMSGEGLDGPPLSARLEHMSRRAAEELSADLIAHS